MEHSAASQSLRAKLAQRGPRGLGASGWIALAAAGLATIAAGVLLAHGVTVALIAVPFVTAALALAVCKPAPAERRLLWLAVAGACALTLFVELFVLEGDLGRMNTQFKAYLQVWLLLGTMAGPLLVIAVERLAARVRAARASRDQARSTQRVAAQAESRALTSARLLRLGFLLPVARHPGVGRALPAARDSRQDRRPLRARRARGLDGAAYMRLATREEAGDGCSAPPMRLEHDYDTIRWLERNLLARRSCSREPPVAISTAGAIASRSTPDYPQ